MALSLHPPRALLLLLALSASLTAAAQYQWIDKAGRRVFSDQPPPADVPPSKVISAPRGSGAGVVRAAPAPHSPAAAASNKPATAASGPAPSGTDKALEERKKQAEAAEAAKQQAEREKTAAAKAENCRRATDAKAGLDAGVVMFRTNPKGEREILDGPQRAQEGKRLQTIIDSDCK